mmetsp:Transcript_12957/g.19144  ORF Transcript_12957/g.19144 Transcript_12957/m.19144 type:complete len:131 (-) Transcript_12957:4785-5177(-)
MAYLCVTINDSHRTKHHTHAFERKAKHNFRHNECTYPLLSHLLNLPLIIDVSNTNEDESSEPEDSYTPFTPMTEMIVTPNNSDASASSSQAASKENVSTVATLTSNANSKRKTFLPTRKSKRGRIPKKFD